MALDKNDFKEIRTIIKEEVPQIVHEQIHAEVPQIVHEQIHAEVPQIVHEQIHAEVPQIVQEVITVEVPPIVESKIYPLKNDLEWIKDKLKRFDKMETEDIRAAYKDIASLKKKTKKLEIKINRLELAKS